MKSDQWLKIKEAFNTAIDLPRAARAPFLEECDAEIRIQVERLLAANDSAKDFIAESAFVDVGFVEEVANDPQIGKHIDSYQILSEIGNGGMGTVYLAARRDFEKKVALKLIKRGMDTNSVLKRFVMERQILAQLQHPSIAGLLDGGSTADGLPYFVMEYVDGLPLTKFCDSKGLDIEERLAIFRKICSAVSYAHRNLVVHRDLKPSNILVANDGTPKLLDFGIAKLLHPDWSLDTNEPTATMFRVMTPEYASPEQIRGLPVTTASDVYSLGVVLYELLSGERPFNLEGRALDEAAQAMLTDEPPKPSAIAISKPEISRGRREALTLPMEADATEESEQKPKSRVRNPKALRGDLDNIILKAIRKEPERRYASVQEFSEDIRKHLNGLPVSATADTASYRIGKFVKRHRTVVLAGGLIFLTLLAATAITAWQSIIARREQAKAEQRFNQVRKLANTVLFEYHDGVAKLAGSTPLRERMVKDALTYLDNLAAENISDPSLQSELASAYFKVGEVQGAPSKSSLGDYGGGLESFRKSLLIREKLLRENPNDDQFKLGLTRSYQMVGHLSQVTDNIPAAFENYGKAFELFESMPTAKRDLANLHARFAQALSASGKLNEAIVNFRKSVAIVNELIAQNPDDRDLKRDLGKTSILFGDALEESGNLDEALETQRNAYAILQPLVLENDTDSQRAAMSAFGRIGDVLFKLGKYSEALEIQFESLAVDEKTLKSDPQNALARRDVQVDFHKIALNYSQLGQMNNALANERKTVDFCEQAVSANPESSESRGDLSVAYYHYAEMLEKSSRLRDALNYFKKATEIEEANSNADPTNTTARSNLSESYLKIGEISIKLGDWSDARKFLLKGLEIREMLEANKQDTAQDRPISAKLYEGLGDYYLPRDANQAKDYYERSLAIWQNLHRDNNILASDAKRPDEVRKKIEKSNSRKK